jgi:hypothetical protein
MSAIANLAIGFERVAKSGSDRPTYIVAQERLPLPRTRLFVWAWRALVHLRSTHGVLRLIATVAPYSELLHSNPRFAFKFLTDGYLARGFSVRESAACFLHHYNRLQQLLPDDLLRDILGEEVTLHQFPDCDDRIALTLGLSRPYDHEGELTLRLRVDGEIVFVLAFTLVPGRVVGSELPEALLITRLQGIRGCCRGSPTPSVFAPLPPSVRIARLPTRKTALWNFARPTTTPSSTSGSPGPIKASSYPRSPSLRSRWRPSSEAIGPERSEDAPSSDRFSLPVRPFSSSTCLSRAPQPRLDNQTRRVNRRSAWIGVMEQRSFRAFR